MQGPLHAANNTIRLARIHACATPQPVSEHPREGWVSCGSPCMLPRQQGSIPTQSLVGIGCHVMACRRVARRKVPGVAYGPVAATTPSMGQGLTGTVHKCHQLRPAAIEQAR